MLDLKIGSSMESHISHFIASYFTARPKGFSTKRIDQYLKLNDYKLNGINIFNLYMQSYKNKEVVKLNEKELNCSIIDNTSSSNMPILQSEHVSELYNKLHAIAH